ncbi:hypothetical protein HCA61_21325 [Rhodococcus sp. HNM0563]|uniref:hypothetical protein n=1 Tax=unclassified Rhodococcus (in: high G+C Gram-positive bacteria) TaxID=192944 RepID=UPI00146A1247|nr:MULTISPECIES: hypothetical protein [unclassified Rhodococcus (in: high G+C Gram-positive bacteria)]MCK0093502.1 hypothetical protein [Rhodococcus sp. F64268]NLU64786.1 hypothetical protein [Rhodococcus sp. HNM0563]
MSGPERRPASCLWCGRPVPEIGTGRRRHYCRRSCRQRAYEQRVTAASSGLAADAVVLSAAEAEALTDRAFEVRCAAEDVATAVDEGADQGELRRLCAELVELARAAERLR